MDKKILANLKYLFATHLAADVFYITKDGSAFFDEKSAAAHGKTIGNETVTPFTRQEIEEAEEPISEEQLHEIFTENRKNLEAEFEAEFGFEAPEGTTDEEMAFAIVSLVKYKLEHPVGELGKIFAQVDAKNEALVLETGNQVNAGNTTEGSDVAPATGSETPSKVEQPVIPAEPEKVKNKGGRPPKIKPEDQTTNA